MLEELRQYEVRMERYENRKKPRNVKEIFVPCAFCGEYFWIVAGRAKTYIEKGRNWFCSREHSALWYAENNDRPSRLGEENAGFSWDKSSGRWSAYWRDEDGTQHSTTKAKWLWEKHCGDVPSGYWVTYIDGDSENCEIDNLELVFRGEIMSKAMMGHEISEETKMRISESHMGKPLSEEHKRKISLSLYRRWDDGEFDEIHVGKYHRRWSGNRTKRYPREFYQIRNQILERDKNKCRICFSREKLHIHHINRNKEKNSVDNLITVCSICHMKIHDSAMRTDEPQILAFRSVLE
jgi:hypothetical protein